MSLLFRFLFRVRCFFMGHKAESWDRDYLVCADCGNTERKLYGDGRAMQLQWWKR